MDSVSIHPRNWPKTGNRAKLNTSKPHQGGGKLAKKQANLNRRQLAREATVKSYRGKSPEGAYKMPGSLNGRK